MTAQQETPVTPTDLPPHGQTFPRAIGGYMLRPFRRLRGNEDISSMPEGDEGIYPDVTEAAEGSENDDSDDSIESQRYNEILNHPLLNSIDPSERAQAATETFKLYKAAKEYVAPVIAGFADSLLREAGGRQIIFAGRDGLGTKIAAEGLKQKLGYNNNDPDQLVYALLTRKIVWNTSPEELQRYVRESGVHDTKESIVVADIGMFGSIVPGMQRVLPNVEMHYLISKTSRVPGYADDQGHSMKSVTQIVGNPAIHFLEDTFSGLTSSPSHLQEVDGRLVPVGADATFSPAEAMKREFALTAIEDYVKELGGRPNNNEKTADIERLDIFLSDPSNFSSLMVPHIR